MPQGAERAQRLAAVLHVLYLIFNEGYAATSGPRLQRVELSAEAIRLARMVHRLLPDDGEVTGLLALYELLLETSDNPVVALNHAVAVAMVHGARRARPAGDAGGRPADRRRPPAAGGPRAPAGHGRRPPGRARRLPGGRPAGDQPPAAALPQRASRPSGRRPVSLPAKDPRSSAGSHARHPRDHCPCGARRPLCTGAHPAGGENSPPTPDGCPE
jgi:hypothetical protein